MFDCVASCCCIFPTTGYTGPYEHHWYIIRDPLRRASVYSYSRTCEHMTMEVRSEVHMAGVGRKVGVELRGA
jgi:hypothetical protein